MLVVTSKFLKIGFRVVHRMGVVLLETVLDSQKRLSEIKLPIYNVHGSDDILCEISGSRMLHEQASSTDKTLQVSLYLRDRRKIFFVCMNVRKTYYLVRRSAKYVVMLYFDSPSRSAIIAPYILCTFTHVS